MYNVYYFCYLIVLKILVVYMGKSQKHFFFTKNVSSYMCGKQNTLKLLILLIFFIINFSLELFKRLTITERSFVLLSLIQIIQFTVS